MTVTRADIENALKRVMLPDGRDLLAHDLVRALTIEGNDVRFVIEAPNAEAAKQMGQLRDAAEQVVREVSGVGKVGVALTAHAPAAKAPSLKLGGHPKPQEGPIKPAGVRNIIAIGSGKGGVGKSTVSSNLAVALARAGRRVGLLDADIYGPSQPRMMGISKRPASPDGKTIIPLQAHGVTMMSIGFMVEEGKAVVWRGPMLMGALQQMMGQVEWGELDVLLVDLPPGTGDVQLTLCTKTELAGAVIVSTPQDVALIDARKALDMFATLKTPVLGLIENMSQFVCPDCGSTHDIFGQGGVAAEAQKLGVPLLGSLPIDLETRLAGDAGTPVAAGDGPMAEAYAGIARDLMERGLA
ncbi:MULTISPECIES: Mrp/NBP35 family ATP-binding protein [unclassified Sulfitobacter]|uniref:Mrp/NBP35 family ATP-binding protein n=1 Tax=unclassified Sulfitobacter TaxID=196795 RepID=UPI0007C3F960|nr:MULTISPECIES: Mrp/NBP35 family ATP-binding protein [unclassified Sulfitobacter]KZY03817.1 sodium:proton antiporter [Sulfitobacter sp. HI0023]KZY22651.1 sodium:proton antiporter [Sulfitobacter sp. HI0040]KZZ63843.1 sodium:proton antiporter [Sulfitobacter sp. HI0129]